MEHKKIPEHFQSVAILEKGSEGNINVILSCKAAMDAQGKRKTTLVAKFIPILADMESPVAVVKKKWV